MLGGGGCSVVVSVFGFSGIPAWGTDVPVAFVCPPEALGWAVGGATLQVPSLLNLIALKLHSIANNSAREARDLGDIAELLAANPGAIDEKDLTEVCAKYGPAGILDRLGRLRT